MTRNILVPTVGLFLLLAGCAQSPAVPVGGAASGPSFDEESGAIHGVVTDDALAPIPGATVALLGSGNVAITGEAGQFHFSNVPPGTVTVLAEANGYASVSKPVDVVIGQSASVQFLLPATASEGAYHVTQIENGRILCGAAWRTAPNTNGTRFAACGAGSLVGNPVEVDNYITPFTLTTDNVSALRTFVFETHWVATQAFGNGLRIEWQGYIDIVAQPREPLRNFIVLMGSSPLRGLVDDVNVAANVTEVDPPLTHCRPNGPCRFWAQNWAYPSTLGPTSQVDVSFYIDQPFTHYVTEFYGDYAPRDFSALADG